MKRILTIIGTRPQSIKTAAVSRILGEEHADLLEERILYTGQHYDRELKEVFFEEMGIPAPSRDLGVGSALHGEQTAKMLQGVEAVLMEEAPELVLVYGDTNSTLAGALAASKLHIPVAHVEAGLRSFKKTMPEELNRILSDHASTLLFTPTGTASRNLEREGFPLSIEGSPSIDRPLVHQAGDVMYDNALHFGEVAERNSDVLERLELGEAPILITFHRAENLASPERLQGILEGLIRLIEKSGKKAVLPLHPGTRKAIGERVSSELRDRFFQHEAVRIADPLPYLDTIRIEKNASLVVTDSGGIQKEAFFHGSPCLVLRDETEWRELVDNGNSVLVGADPERISKGMEQFSGRKEEKGELFGDGNAGRYICQRIRDFLDR